MAVVGVLLLNPLRKRRRLPPLPPTSALGPAQSCTEQKLKGHSSRVCKPREGEELAPGYKAHQGRRKGQTPEPSLGTPCASHPREGFLGAVMPDRSRPAAGGPAEPGDPGKPSAGAGSRSQSPRGLPDGAEVAAGAASWARVELVPGKPGSARGAVNPEVRLHLHPLLSVLGKLQAPPPPALLPHRRAAPPRTRAGGEASEGCA